jgi:hypothetical protein
MDWENGPEWRFHRFHSSSSTHHRLHLHNTVHHARLLRLPRCVFMHLILFLVTLVSPQSSSPVGRFCLGTGTNCCKINKASLIRIRIFVVQTCSHTCAHAPECFSLGFAKARWRLAPCATPSPRVWREACVNTDLWWQQTSTFCG